MGCQDQQLLYRNPTVRDKVIDGSKKSDVIQKFPNLVQYDQLAPNLIQ